MEQEQPPQGQRHDEAGAVAADLAALRPLLATLPQRQALDAIVARVAALHP